MKAKFYLSTILLALLFINCSDDEDPVKSSGKQIISVKISEDDNATISVDNTTKKISIVLANTISLDAISLLVTVSDKAILTPISGSTHNFNNGNSIQYTVTAEDGSNHVYEASASKTGSPAKNITAFSLPSIYQEGTISEQTITLTVPYGTDVTTLTPQISLSIGAKSEPETNTPVNFTQPVEYTITAEDNTTVNYTVKVNIAEQESVVRAVWIPDPIHTTAMRTYQNVINTVQLLDELNFNTIYVASWVRSQTSFKSQVLLENSTYNSVDEGYLFTHYLPMAYNYPTQSPTSDPLKDLITEAHKKGIKVILWFEYGFMASANNEPTIANNPIMAKYPDWIGRSNVGGVSNYNNSDYYFNSYNPEVQEFLLNLIEESLELYPEVDGIQGDDRMPAMPRNAGYESYTVDLYKTQHQGQEPPQNYNDANWVRWRLDILNNFGKTLHNRIKSKKNNAILSFSPNPYPWCEDNLMQQWPQWIADGIVDILSVQCYRYDIASYEATVNMAKNNVASKTNKNLLNPGMILKSGSTIMTETLLLAQLRANRKLNTNGEAYFYVDGLKDPTVQKVLKAFYPGKAKFPDLN